MTLEQLFHAFVTVLRKRLANMPNPPKELRERVEALTLADMPTQAQGLLRTIPAAADGRTGSCNYQVNGQSFCLENVTATECANLGGIFTEGGFCALPSWPPQ